MELNSRVHQWLRDTSLSHSARVEELEAVGQQKLSQVPRKRSHVNSEEGIHENLKSHAVGQILRRNDFDEHNKTAPSNQPFESAIAEQLSVDPYQRRPRWKTRPDKYDTKVSRSLDKNAAQTMQGKKRRRKKSGAKINCDFRAPNVVSGRLTLHPHKSVGFLGKGKGYNLLDQEGLPDLTFADMAFLERRNNDSTIPEVRKGCRKQYAANEISDYFSGLDKDANHLRPRNGDYSSHLSLTDQARSMEHHDHCLIGEIDGQEVPKERSIAKQASTEKGDSMSNPPKELSKGASRTTTSVSWSTSPERVQRPMILPANFATNQRCEAGHLRDVGIAQIHNSRLEQSRTTQRAANRSAKGPYGLVAENLKSCTGRDRGYITLDGLRQLMEHHDNAKIQYSPATASWCQDNLNIEVPFFLLSARRDQRPIVSDGDHKLSTSIECNEPLRHSLDCSLGISRLRTSVCSGPDIAPRRPLDTAAVGVIEPGRTAKLKHPMQTGSYDKWNADQMLFLGQPPLLLPRLNPTTECEPFYDPKVTTYKFRPEIILGTSRGLRVHGHSQSNPSFDPFSYHAAIEQPLVDGDLDDFDLQLLDDHVVYPPVKYLPTSSKPSFEEDDKEGGRRLGTLGKSSGHPKPQKMPIKIVASSEEDYMAHLPSFWQPQLLY